VASDVMLEPRLPIRVKGKAEPQPVAAVQAPRARKVFRLEEPRHALPMVGRDAERSRIAEIQSLALAGRGQVVGVLGAAGIGKSRLLADAIRLAHQRGLTGYGAACLATGQNSPYLAWAPIWQAFFHVDPDAPISLQARALAQALEDLVPDHQEALPLLGPLLRLALPENSFTRALPPNMRRAALHSLLRDCLATAARAAHQTGGGLLLVLEDLHWIDSASLDLLHDLARAIGDLPILIMLSYRPPDDPPPQLLRIESLPHTARIALESLSLADAEQLIETKLAQLFPSGDDGLAPAGLAAQITDLAQGSPFYIEELLNYLRDRAIDPRTARLDQIELPDSLHRLVLSRLGQLSARQQALLKSASIIGRRFPLDWLRGAFGALHPAETLSADLAALARADLVTIDTPEPELAYVFKHVVTQEVVYTSMSAATRAMLHEQLADYLEHLSGSAPERPLDLLAYHYERGADPLKRRHYLRRAGEAAAARFANEAAADYFTRALNMTPPEEHAERFELLLARERTHHLMGRRADQASDLSALEDQANLLDDDARRALVAERRAHHALLIQDLPAAEPALHAAVRLGLETNATDVAVRAYAWWTWQLWLQGDYSAARRRAAAGLDLAARAGDVAGEALVLTYLALVDERQGRYAEAHAAFARTLQIAQALDNRAGEADALGHLARLISTHHMQPIAWEYARMALDIYRVIGHRRGEVIALEQLALAALRRGALAAALDAALEGLVLARQAGDREIEGQLQHLLGEVAHRAGQHGQAQTAYEQALATAQALAERWAECSRQISLAALRHHQGDQAGALALARAGLATAQAQEVSPEQAAALTVAGHALAAQGRWAEATAAYRETLDLRLRMEQPQYVAEARASLARVALASGDLRAASGYIQSVLPDLALGEVDCADEPLLVYLTCYEVLSAAGDPRVREVLADARSLLQRLSANMPNDEARRSFLAQPISRRIAEALER
jgi:predicted ATPase